MTNSQPHIDCLGEDALMLFYFSSTGEGAGRWQSVATESDQSGFQVEFYPTSWFSEDLFRNHGLFSAIALLNSVASAGEAVP